MTNPTHFGDPCIHCGTNFERLQIGACNGDMTKSIPISYCELENRWDGVIHYRIRFSDMRIEDRWQHSSYHSPYFHFGYSDELIQPPRYDERLRIKP